MNSVTPPKVALVTNMLPPYRVSFYNELSRLVDLSVVMDTVSEFNRGWQVDLESLDFDLKVLDSRSLVYTRKRRDVDYQEKRQFHFSEKLISTLREIRPDVIISIEFGLKTLWSEIYGHIHKCPVVILSEGTPHTEGHVGGFKRMFRRLLVSQLAGAWSNGPESTELLENYGLPKGMCQPGMTGIETEDWRQAVESFLPERERLRDELGLKGRVFLFSASLTPRKGVKEMLAVAGRLADRCEDFSLLILGSGEEEERLREFQQQFPQISLCAPGFVQRDELPRFFAMADWAVLPTLDDNWPLATLETLVAGLPQIFSVYNGASADLCELGVTGLVCDPLELDDFERAWRLALDQSSGRIPEGTVSRFSDYYSPRAQAERAVSYLNTMLKQESDV